MGPLDHSPLFQQSGEDLHNLGAELSLSCVFAPGASTSCLWFGALPICHMNHPEDGKDSYLSAFNVATKEE